MCVIGMANPATVFPTVPSEVVINNEFHDVDCEVPAGDGDDNSGYVAFAWVGWSILIIEFIAIVALVIFYFVFWRRRRNSSGHHPL